MYQHCFLGFDLDWMSLFYPLSFHFFSSHKNSNNSPHCVCSALWSRTGFTWLGSSVVWPSTTPRWWTSTSPWLSIRSCLTCHQYWRTSRSSPPLRPGNCAVTGLFARRDLSISCSGWNQLVTPAAGKPLTVNPVVPKHNNTVQQSATYLHKQCFFFKQPWNWLSLGNVSLLN